MISEGVRAGLQTQLDEWCERDGMSGIATITQGGAVVFQACCGLANRADDVPITARTRFGLASLTKMFTAVAVAGLVRDGLTSFDTAVSEILPLERRPSTLRPDVTLHHLLTHTSGMADYFEEEGDDAANEPDYAQLWRERPCYAMRRPADFLPLFGELAPYRPPGRRFQYSNAGYVVLAAVVEELTGQAYTDAVTDRVFTPAGMDASGFFSADEPRPDLATGYVPPSRPGDPWRSNIFSIPPIGGGDGGAWSNTADIDRFLIVYDDASLLGGPLRDRMLSRHVQVEDDLDMGYGVFIGADGRFGHGGGDPGVEVLAQRFPALDANVIVLSNSEGFTDRMRNLLRDALLSSSPGAPDGG